MSGASLVRASKIAVDCGIYKHSDELAMDSDSLFDMPLLEQNQIIPNIKVLAKTSCQQKLSFINR